MVAARVLNTERLNQAEVFHFQTVYCTARFITLITKPSLIICSDYANLPLHLPKSQSKHSVSLCSCPWCPMQSARLILESRKSGGDWRPVTVYVLPNSNIQLKLLKLQIIIASPNCFCIRVFDNAKVAETPEPVTE